MAKAVGINGNNLEEFEIASSAGLIKYTQANLTIDFNNGSWIVATIAANASFSLSNVQENFAYLITVKNSSGSGIVITLPNTADEFQRATERIAPTSSKDFSLIYDGTIRRWLVSDNYS
ncbi:MAG: hypothetical protein M9949_06225 [Candidatus Kapabacteria bacterium]|nr:hypothetical protein [Candidatus Kapabacteria bacterium]